jgi:hypothetical protein
MQTKNLTTYLQTKSKPPQTIIKQTESKPPTKPKTPPPRHLHFIRQVRGSVRGKLRRRGASPSRRSNTEKE